MLTSPTWKIPATDHALSRQWLGWIQHYTLDQFSWLTSLGIKAWLILITACSCTAKTRASWGGGHGILLPQPQSSTPPPPPPPPRKLEIECGYYCYVTSIKQQSCPKFCQKQSERIWIQIFLGAVPPDPPSRHTCLHVCERAFRCYYHPAIILFKILYKNLKTTRLK